MATLVLPFPTFTPGTPAYANQIQDNYVAIRDHINGQNIGTGNIEATLVSRVGGPILFLNQQSQEQIALSILNSRSKSAFKIQQTALLSAGNSIIHIKDDASHTLGDAQVFLELLVGSTIPALLVKHGAVETFKLRRTQLDLFASAVEISNERLKLPVRTIAQRNTVTQEGSIVYNTDTDQINVRRSDSWSPVDVPVGSMQLYAGSVAPEGWLLCGDVTLDSVANPEYAKLFAVIGTTYGGTGASAFKLPDTRGRTAIGVGTGSGLTARALAATGGAETHTLTISQMPSHTHTDSGHSHTGAAATGPNANPGFPGGVVGSSSSNTGTASANIQATGGGQAHNNMQPFIALNYIIKY